MKLGSSVGKIIPKTPVYIDRLQPETQWYTYIMVHTHDVDHSETKPSSPLLWDKRKPGTSVYSEGDIKFHLHQTPRTSSLLAR